MLTILTQFIETYGYLAIAVSLALGSAGLPLPGETMLLVAGAYAATGHLSLPVVITVAAIAAIVGDAAGYWVGRRGGRPLLERHGRWLRLDTAKIARIDTFFARHGPKTVFFGRFVSGLQTYGALFAGISRMGYATFTRYNVLGGIVWAILYSALGYVFGRNLDLVDRWVTTVGWALLLVVGLIVGSVISWRWIAQHQADVVARWQRLVDRPTPLRLRRRYHRQLAWLLARLTPGQYLGLHLTLGLLASVACLWLLAGVTEDVLHNDPLVQVDNVVATALRTWNTPFSTLLFTALSQFGLLLALVLAVIVTLLYIWRRLWLQVQTWLVAIGGGWALAVVLTRLFVRGSAPGGSTAVIAAATSFPSTHALIALLVYGMLAYFAVLTLHSWRARTAVVVGVGVFVLVIGFSRLALGVQYLSDVLGGFAAAGVWLSTCITGMELVRRREFGSRWEQPARRTPPDAG